MKDVFVYVSYFLGVGFGVIGAGAVLIGQPRTLETVSLVASGAFVIAIAAFLRDRQ